MSDEARLPLTLLYVEDEDETRETMARILRRRFDRVVAVRGVDEALAALAPDCPDVVVTDIQLPGIDGWTLLGHVRRRCGDVPVIVTTAFELSECREHLEALDVAVALMKPVDLDGLEGAILACVGRLGPRGAA